MYVRQTGLLKSLHHPFAGQLELLRTCQSRPDMVRQILQVRFQFRLVSFHLRQYFRIHVADRVRLLASVLESSALRFSFAFGFLGFFAFR